MKLLTSSVARNLGSTPDYVIILCGRDDCLRSKSDTRPVTDPDKVYFRSIICNSVWPQYVPTKIDTKYFQFRKNLYSLVDKFTNEIDMNLERFILLSPLPIHSMRFEGDDSNVFDGTENYISSLRFNKIYFNFYRTSL